MDKQQQQQPSYQNPDYMVYRDPATECEDYRGDQSELLVAIAIFIVGFIFWPVWAISFCFVRSTHLGAKILGIISIVLFFLTPILVVIVVILFYHKPHNMDNGGGRRELP
ncbi:hypothetical protein PPL_01839 [Heterostelium album PN500]|uniref:Transmembrane protein n=1 Tax=Heterostelium pallidum (strain ATCC 26659 / Pp 5 / PN500) TaxID=670386 RepID=D3B0M2_HETP5|nr:hypothetical protein PPL_01839 [Heterostelium album PN500]EFA84846.1 hypothetical protein PPL_01839 [Heterostelium album PN500]|eukprot:XP_020436957.1 hypothetical protein PPL_01839 [Heterostelium album PN500]